MAEFELRKYIPVCNINVDVDESSPKPPNELPKWAPPVNVATTAGLIEKSAVPEIFNELETVVEIAATHEPPYNNKGTLHTEQLITIIPLSKMALDEVREGDD